MNILFLTQVDLSKFGDGIHVYNTALELARLNHNVKLICKDTKAFGKTRKRAGNSALSIKRIRGFRGFHTILYIPQALFYGTRYIATSKIDIIYERVGLVSIGHLLSKLFRKPLVLAAQGVKYYESEAKLADADSRFMTNRFVIAILKKMTKMNYKSASRIITVTPQIKHLICTQYGINPQKIIVSSNGADTNLFKPIETKKAKEELNLDKKARYVCYVGSLSPWQGLEYLIKAAPQILENCPSARFLFVGDGKLKENLINLTQQIGVFDKFIFSGAVPYEDVPKYINASEVCVSPAACDAKNRIAGMSVLKVFEYMACGKPVIVGNAEGDKGLISKSNAGRATNPEDPHELANAIIELLKDKQLSKRLGENGRKVVAERYSWASVTKRVAEVCQKAIRGFRTG